MREKFHLKRNQNYQEFSIWIQINNTPSIIDLNSENNKNIPGNSNELRFHRTWKLSTILFNLYIQEK